MKSVTQKKFPWQKFEDRLLENYLDYFERRYRKDVLLPGLINYAEIDQILIICLQDKLGDFLLATPAIRAMREEFPKARIGVVASGHLSDAVRENPYIDEIIPAPNQCEKVGCRVIWRFWKRIRNRWDLAVVLNPQTYSLLGDLIAQFSGANYLLGSVSNKIPDVERNFFYNLRAPSWPHQRHYTERYMDIVRHIGAETADLRPVLQLNDAEKIVGREQLDALGVDDRLPIVGVHIGAGNFFNRWPVGRFGLLANELKEKCGAEILLFWGPEEKDLAEQFLNYVHFKPHPVEPASVRRFAAIISYCDVFVCNDTGMMQVAAALGIPVVAIFGPTSPYLRKPLGDRVLALKGDTSSTDAVQTDRVFAAVVNFLSRKYPTLRGVKSADTHDTRTASSPGKAFDISESVLDRYLRALGRLVDADSE